MLTRTLTLTLALFGSIGTANAQILGGSGGITGFLPIIAIFAIMYFFMFRPQSKKAKEHREMVAALKRGDRVVVASGILGVVSKVIDDAEIAVEIASGVEIKVVRSSVSQIVSKKTPAEKDVSDKPAIKKTAALKKKAAPRNSSVIKK